MSQLEPVRDALGTLAERVVVFLPNLLAALLMLVVGWLVSRLLAAALRRILIRMDIETAAEKAGWNETLARAKIETKPTEIFARLLFWIVFVVFLVLAVENLGLEMTAVPLRTFIAYLPRILGAAVLLLVGSTVARLLASVVAASLARIRFEQHALLAAGIRWLVLLVTFMAIIEHLGFDVTLLAGILTNLLTILAAGLAVTFALGGREAARNILAGYYARERYQPGETLALSEGTGELEGIGTLTSLIRLEDGSLVVPNSRLMETTVRKRE